MERIQYKVTFIRHFSDSFSNSLQYTFKFSLIHQSLIGTAQEMEKFHTLKITISEDLIINWLRIDFDVSKPTEEVTKIVFQCAEEYIKEQLKSNAGILPSELPPIFMTTKNSDSSCPYKLTDISYPEQKSFIVEMNVDTLESGILRYIEVQGVGPVDPLIFEPSTRLNIIIGDNGLGKTFLLDVAWWTLTQQWAERPAEPDIEQHKTPYIKFLVSNTTQQTQPVTVKFSRQALSWEYPERILSISSLVIYARVDGSFAVWDPVNRMLSGKTTARVPSSVVFSHDEVWNGKEGQIEGLLRDWTRWQERKDKYPIFGTFRNVLQKLAPSDMGRLEIGEPRRIFGEIREIPTLVHPYGTVPIVFESAGIKRITTLAYLIVWAWEEHKTQAKLLGRKEERQMVILLDEAEAHLHPKWQRKILPALLEIAEDLHAELSLQLIVATHSPLVMASSEPIFDEEQDQVFHLGLTKSGKVEFTPLKFQIRGNVDSWLSSDFFGLNFPGNEKRSHVIQQAISLQESEMTTPKDVEMISDQLKELLSAEDPFWIRWLLYAEQFGVQL